MKKTKAVISWSAGKDSTLALHKILTSGTYEVDSLLTTVTEKYSRISMHGIRCSLLQMQARSLGLKLRKLPITINCTDETYKQALKAVLLEYKDKGVEVVVFGDIFLEDVRQYRIDILAELGMKAVFPLWGKKSRELAGDFLNLGYKAYITCIDSKCLDKTFCGRLFDRSFLSDLPLGIDPCGERGEFHSFSFSGPIFRKKINCRKGKTILRDARFYFCDFLPDKS